MFDLNRIQTTLGLGLLHSQDWPRSSREVGITVKRPGLGVGVSVSSLASVPRQREGRGGQERKQE
jgi:hypothetical protein